MLTNKKLVGAYLAKEDFKCAVSEELINKSYTDFCNDILERDVAHPSHPLSSLKYAAICRRLFTDLQSEIKTNMNYLIRLEIVIFISLIEGYVSDRNYEKIEKFLKREFEDHMNKKDLMRLINKYYENNSLRKKVRDFMSQVPHLDKLYLLSCHHQDIEFQGSHRPFEILRLMIKKHPHLQISKIKTELQRLQQIQNELSSAKSQNYSELKELHYYFKDSYLGDSDQQSIIRLSNQLYDVRSKFMHTNEKEGRFGFSFDQKSGTLYCFEHVDFFRLFIRTILLMSNFEINVINLPIRES